MLTCGQFSLPQVCPGQKGYHETNGSTKIAPHVNCDQDKLTVGNDDMFQCRIKTLATAGPEAKSIQDKGPGFTLRYRGCLFNKTEFLHINNFIMWNIAS